jgi:hypothetical protein
MRLLSALPVKQTTQRVQDVVEIKKDVLEAEKPGASSPGDGGNAA